ACGPEKFRYAQDDFVLTHAGKPAAFVSDVKTKVTRPPVPQKTAAPRSLSSTSSKTPPKTPPRTKSPGPANDLSGSQLTGRSSKTSPSPTSPRPCLKFERYSSSSDVNGSGDQVGVASPEVNGNTTVSSSVIGEKYCVGKSIGDGNFAVVKECVERSTGQEFALKIIDKARCSG
ncbi:hypothetical protein CRUP_005238, partial [Coryphaenoides rupestris]